MAKKKVITKTKYDRAFISSGGGYYFRMATIDKDGVVKTFSSDKIKESSNIRESDNKKNALFGPLSSAISDATKKFTSLINSATGSTDPNKLAAISKQEDVVKKLNTELEELLSSSTPPTSFSIIHFDIPPQAIAVNVPFAINVTATNRGVLEEHNGVVFRNISIAGVTGITGSRKPAEFKNRPTGGALGLVANIFPAATAAVNSLLESPLAKAIKGALASKNNDTANAPDFSAEQLNSGYSKFWQLNNFLMVYAEIKKKHDNANIRLIFGSYKDNIEYVVTPLSFDLKRDISQPMMYRYAIQLKGWDITDDVQNKTTDIKLPTPDNQAALSKFLADMLSARNDILKARNVVKALVGDFNVMIGSIATMANAAKDILGIGADLLSFPGVIANNISTAGKVLDNQLKSALAELNSNGNEKYKKVLGVDTSSASVISYKSDGSPTAQAQSKLSAASNSDGSTSSGSSFSSGSGNHPGGENKDINGGSNARDPNDMAIQKVIADAIYDPDVGAKIEVNPDDFPIAIQEQINAEKQKSQEMTADSVRDIAKKMKEASDTLITSVGLMDLNYTETYGLPAPTTGRTPNEDDIILSAALEKMRDTSIALLSSGEIFKEVNPDPFLGIQGGLSADDAIPTPTSSYIVRLNKDEGIQEFAGRVLGDQNRWREIAILNGLKPPYFDVSQQSMTFGAPSGRTILVSSNEGLFIGMRIKLVANTTIMRNIINIENLSSAFRLTLDGEDNLSSMAPSLNKVLFFNKAGTVGPGEMLLVPSGGAPDQEPISIRPTALSQRLSHAERVFGVDIAVDDSGDIIFGADGDIVKSYGYDNAEQALKLSLTVEKNELPDHPDFGLDIPIGSRNSTVSFDAITESVRNQITSDSRFSDAQIVIDVAGEEVRIGVIAKGSEGTGLIPVGFKIGLT